MLIDHYSIQHGQSAFDLKHRQKGGGSMTWFFETDRPIYTQLLEQIQQRIITGVYGPGEKLPPVRELAMEAGVNPNTMQKAMAELERTGLIHAQRTTGRFVTEDAQMIRDLRQQLALDKIAGFLRSMQELGYEQSEILGLMGQKNVTEATKCLSDGLISSMTERVSDKSREEERR